MCTDTSVSFIHAHTIGTNLVIVRSPDAIEYVLRAEGKYPRRDIGVTDGVRWLLKNRVKVTTSMVSE